MSEPLAILQEGTQADGDTLHFQMLNAGGMGMFGSDCLSRLARFISDNRIASLVCLFPTVAFVLAAVLFEPSAFGLPHHPIGISLANLAIYGTPVFSAVGVAIYLWLSETRHWLPRGVVFFVFACALNFSTMIVVVILTRVVLENWLDIGWPRIDS